MIFECTYTHTRGDYRYRHMVTVRLGPIVFRRSLGTWLEETEKLRYTTIPEYILCLSVLLQDSSSRLLKVL